MALGTLRQIIIPVDDVQSAVAHYRDELGLPLRFQDGARYAAFALDELTLALAGPGEQPVAGEVALAVKVTDVDAALAAVTDAGGVVLAEPQDGGHERRASCRDRFGTAIALYSPTVR
jgi:predicted enzyme related to lactoylglutathione lyase